MEEQLSIKACGLIAKLYDALKPRYIGPDNANTLKSNFLKIDDLYQQWHK